MSNTIEQHNVTAEGYKAIVSAATNELAKAGYKTAIEVTQHANTGYGGSHEMTTIRVIFGESSNKAIDAYKANIAAAKANVADLAAKHNIAIGEFTWIDSVVAMIDNPFTTYDNAGNIVMTITGACARGNGIIDSISYKIYNVLPNTDTKRSWDGLITEGQRTSEHSSGSIRSYNGRPISPESTAKRLVKNIADCFAHHLTCNVWSAATLTSAGLAEKRSEVVAMDAEHACIKANSAFIAGLVPNAKTASVERKYRGSSQADDVQIRINISLADVCKHLADNVQYPSNDQLMTAVVAMIKASK